jgi:dihydroneopterin aldolase
MHEINLKGMFFGAASVGILPEERTTTQPIEIDLSVVVEDGESVVDYRGLYDATSAVMHSGHIDYLEEIGDRIARGALAHSDRVRVARVAVRKPRVSLNGPLDFAEVVVVRAAGA